MIFQWLNHPSFHRDEQLMSILYDLGIATTEQLQIITSWSYPFMKKTLRKIRNREMQNEEKDQWLKSYPIRGGKLHQKAYVLGKVAMKYVQEMRLIERRLREPPQAQINHFLGTTNILTRLLEEKIDLTDISWWSTSEATETLWRLVERTGKTFDKKSLIRPDARLILKNKKYWIEFDNNTETTRKLERKFHEYIQTLASVVEKNPVIWVTITEKRRNYLQQNWEAILKAFYNNTTMSIPEMHFFTQGEDTTFFLNQDRLPPILDRNKRIPIH